jgi:pimeloyl-ACP methyl ester carboxylesterase
MSRKPPVVLLHGACSQPEHFDAWRDRFAAAGYGVVVPPLPGHAPVDRGVLRATGFAGYVEAAREAVQGLGEPPLVVGHSMGGLIARMLAAERLTAAIVLVSPLPGGRVPAPAGAIPYFAAVAPFVLAGLPFRPRPSAIRRLALHDLPRAEGDAVAAGFVPESGRAYRDLVFGRAKVKRRAVRCPMLVLHGSADRLVPLKVARGIADKHGARFVIVPDHGHWLIAPSLVALVADRALAWLAEAGTAGKGARRRRNQPE